MEIALHLLAIIVGTGSVSLYLAAFFFPEVHRRHDFFWSGVGCFYGLILWLDAGQISPTELMGHGASISLMGWLGWQTLTLRRKRTPTPLQTPYTADSWPTFRREMTALGLDALRQTPLRRWLPQAPAEVSSPKPEIRMSGLKAVGYEFVDSVEPPEPAIGPRRPAPAEDVEASPTPLRRSSTAVNQPIDPSPDAEPPRPIQATPIATPITTPIADPKAMTWGQRLQGLKAWGQDLVRARATPKPQKAVIEIPPRPSSLAKRPTPPPSPAPSVPPAPSPSVASSPVADTAMPSEGPDSGRSPELPQTPDPGETSNWGDEEEDWI